MALRIEDVYAYSEGVKGMADEARRLVSAYMAETNLAEDDAAELFLAFLRSLEDGFRDAAYELGREWYEFADWAQAHGTAPERVSGTRPGATQAASSPTPAQDAPANLRDAPQGIPSKRPTGRSVERDSRARLEGYRDEGYEDSEVLPWVADYAAARLDDAVHEENRAGTFDAMEADYLAASRSGATRRGRRISYARVPTGDACAFCVMMASRGPVAYRSARSAGFSGGSADGLPVGDGYHAHCRCTVVPCVAVEDIEGYDPDGYYVQYRAARRKVVDGDLTPHQRESMRRAYERRKAEWDKMTPQQRKGKNRPDAQIYDVLAVMRDDYGYR